MGLWRRRMGLRVLPLQLMCVAFFVATVAVVHPAHTRVQRAGQNPASANLEPAIAGSPQPLPPLRVVWEMHGDGCTGFAIEANTLLASMSSLQKDGLEIAIVHTIGRAYCTGTPAADIAILDEMSKKSVNDWDIDIWVSHRPPSDWPKFPGYVADENKTKVNKRPKYIVGRSMFESLVLPPAWRERVSADSAHGGVDEIWVPARFLDQPFRDLGAKVIRIMPESIDVNFYSPERVNPVHAGEFGFPPLENKYVFYSVFKLEERKGWHQLLEAYWKEFNANEKVLLVIQTYIFHSDGVQNPSLDHNKNEIMRIFRAYGQTLSIDIDRAPPLHIIPDFVPMSEMPRLYRTSDAFVAPFKGEGWGLPVFEAMAMERPTIATNFSGPTEFLTEANSYPLKFDRIEKGMAEPSVSHLRTLMRHVFSNREEAKAKGRQARADIVSRFSREKVAAQYVAEFRRIQQEKLTHP